MSPSSPPPAGVSPTGGNLPLADRLKRSVARLSGEYYSACHTVFRTATDQSARMRAHLAELTADRTRLSILSVGAGAGLFELPMLKSMLANGMKLTRFVGTDIDQHACNTLNRRMREWFGDELEFQVLRRAFEEFETDERFDLVLFVHSFEYLTGDPKRWIDHALGLLAEAGRLVIFSPQRGGINRIYEQVTDGCFSDDLERTLNAGGFEYAAELVRAECDIAPLSDATGEDRVALLSFLTQLDCRSLAPETLDELVDYYRSLRDPTTKKVLHPTTAFVITG